MTKHTRRASTMTAVVGVLAVLMASGCFSGEAADNAQDCSTVRTALETAKRDLTEAQQTILSSPDKAQSELKEIAAGLRSSSESVRDAELKNAMTAAAGDLEKAFGGSGMPSADLGAGLAELDNALQSKCSTG